MSVNVGHRQTFGSTRQSEAPPNEAPQPGAPQFEAAPNETPRNEAPPNAAATRPTREELLESAKRPQAHKDILYIRSYLLIRTLVGLIGVALPTALLLGDSALPGNPLLRGSLSAYYHSGVRDVFVGSLCAIGVFLIAYRVFERNLDNLLGTSAGAGAILVALFPTGRPPIGDIPQTPLQQALGEDFVKTVHFVGAALFITCCALVCLSFGRREGERGQDRANASGRARLSPHTWMWIHRTCGWLIFAALAFVVLTNVVGRFDEHSLLYGEIFSIYAFGISWFLKGFEYNMLWPRESAQERLQRSGSDDAGQAAP